MYDNFSYVEFSMIKGDKQHHCNEPFWHTLSNTSTVLNRLMSSIERLFPVDRGHYHIFPGKVDSCGLA